MNKIPKGVGAAVGFAVATAVLLAIGLTYAAVILTRGVGSTNSPMPTDNQPTTSETGPRPARQDRTLEDGSILRADGALVRTDGVIIMPNGTVILPDEETR